LSRGFLGRIARHPTSGARDAREDRLTEVCAAVFASPHCSGLARFVAVEWLQAAVTDERLANRALLAALRDQLAEDGADWSCNVRTQLSVALPDGARRPDLELRFRNVSEASAPDVVIWVEVKHGTAPHTRQLHAYLDAQRDSLSRGAVLLVAPRTSYPFTPAEIPAEVPQLTWQQTARIIGNYPTPDPVGQFLIDELRNYLAEEELMDPEQLTPVHLVALANYQEAREALDLVCDAAAAWIDKSWNEQTRGQWPQTGTARERWWSYANHARDTPPIAVDERWGWSWEVIYDSAWIFPDRRVGVPCIGAGMTADRGSIATLEQRSQDRLLDAEFELRDKTRTRSTENEYVWRIVYPEDVLAGATIDAQGKMLADWVIAAFSDLRTALSA
jgi:hypothetical protein